MRHFDIDDPLKPSLADLKDKYSNDICFRILQNSTFFFNVNKTDGKTIINSEKIQINDKKSTEQMSIDEIMKQTSENIIINDNYQRLLSKVIEIKSIIEKEYINNFSFQFNLTFKIKTIKDIIFNITCLYILEIPEKGKSDYKDENIFKEQILGGLQYFLTEINTQDE